MRKPKIEYAIYKHEDLMFVGTAAKCADFLEVKIDTIYQKAWRTKENKYKSKIKIYQVEND